MIRGTLEAYWETGLEGVRWALVEDGEPSYDRLHAIRDGDQLTVYADESESRVLWQGVVRLEYERRWREYPRNPGYGQQAIFGYWVHGFQADLEPETWAQMFLEQRRASLLPAEHAGEADSGDPRSA